MAKKTSLNWRLKDLPDAVDVAELVDKKVITPEEARQLLFNENNEDSNKVKALEEEVKFLRELCDTLAKKSNGWTTVVKEYHDFTPKYPYWYNRYNPVMYSLNAKTDLAIDMKYTEGSISKTNAVVGMNTLLASSISDSVDTKLVSASNIKGLSSLNK